MALSPVAVAPARWDDPAVRQLIAVIRAADAEGLDPRDYQLSALERAARSGGGAELGGIADAASSALPHDYYFGRVSDRGAMGWMIERSPYAAARVQQGLQAAVAAGTVTQFYRGLLPNDTRYAAFREALAGTSDPAARDRLRANMERARWMPRDAVSSYIYVNVPSYRLEVVSDGVATSTYTVVVGARDTPTPLMISPTSSLVVNPWWNVPQSIVRKSNMRPGRAGFQFTATGDGSWAVRQPPGPRNALGRLKFNLVNDQAIYLHDTPAKAGFARDDRALSHGCIRVKNIDRLAAELMGEGSDARGTGILSDALGRTRTATLRLPQTWPVYIVYFTADVDPQGRLVAYDDTYGYDAKLIVALSGKPMEMASR